MKKINTKKQQSKILLYGSFLVLIIMIIIANFFIPKVVIDMNGNRIVSLNYGDGYSDLGAKAYLKAGFLSRPLDVKTVGIVDTQKIGSYIITYHADYKMFNKDLIRIVKVVDTEEPIITFSDDVKICENNKLVALNAKAVDNYDGDITDKIKFKIDGTKAQLIVADSSNNTYIVTKDVVIIDDEKPTISLKEKSTIYLTQGEEYIEYGAKASDSCDGDLSNKITQSGKVDTNTVGSYEIVYKVKDSSGKEASVKRYIIVSEKSNPVTPTPDNNTTAKGGIIYLTFDDGPGGYTEKILNVLDKYNVKATFFVTNQMGSKYQYLIGKEYQKGHTVGIHTYSHKWSIYDSVDSYLDDFNKIREIVVEQTGQEPKYFRFPGGTSNRVAKTSMSYLAKMMTEKGYVYFDWHTSVEDAGGCTKKSSESEREKCVLNNFKKGISKNNNNIVLMHDIKKNTANALEDMIIYAKNNGYTFKAIDDSTPVKHFTPYN